MSEWGREGVSICACACVCAQVCDMMGVDLPDDTVPFDGVSLRSVRGVRVSG